jgi:NAD(P)-dependent dehydrogenase (short-subunit alcohol dehydrogenase family)
VARILGRSTGSGSHRWRRWGQPQDIADMVTLLAGEDARWITGQNIRAADELI